MSNPATPKIAPFKSERAAKMAMTKAEKAYNEAVVRSNGAYKAALDARLPDPMEAHEAAQRAKDAAYAYGAAVYTQARAQGFWVRTYQFGDNVTRDLISANMD